ncbi:MAG: prepilin-type N-terminal cleavage/methylation domain-containing protein [Rickettsiales bacterium]|nr:prepilin-type N-terminal cleavage/methylation domain-containing protein [Rickettsiales bacterium]
MKKHNYIRIKAFSLLELSISILVIGVLVAGTFQANDFIVKTRIKSAQSFTKSSPVAGIKGLVLWLEPTLDESFNNSELTDGTTLTIWKDINPQTISRFYALKISGSPTYKEVSPINNIPSVYTNGGVFSISTNYSSVVNSYIATSNNSFTFFAVYLKNIDAGNGQGQYMIDADTWYYSMNGNNDSQSFGSFSVGSIAQSVSTTRRKPEIATLTYNDSASSTGYYYINGALIGNSALSIAVPDNRFNIGGRSSAYRTWNGHISEIIMYDRVLKYEEIKAVEKYLGKKYNIIVSD